MRAMKPIIRDERMNGTEARYAKLLDLRKKAGEIINWRFEPFGLRLASKTYYHPDFLVVYPGHFEIHEVKGFWRDDARAKIKMAAELFPWFKFVAVKSERGRWVYEEF
jgi:hypothetical protein